MTYSNKKSIESSFRTTAPSSRHKLAVVHITGLCLMFHRIRRRGTRNDRSDSRHDGCHVRSIARLGHPAVLHKRPDFIGKTSVFRGLWRSRGPPISHSQFYNYLRILLQVRKRDLLREYLNVISTKFLFEAQNANLKTKTCKGINIASQRYGGGTLE